MILVEQPDIVVQVLHEKMLQFCIARRFGDKPVPEPCPQCSAPFLVAKHTSRGGNFKACLTKDCRYKAPL